MLDDRRMAGRLARDFRVFLRQARRDESFLDVIKPDARVA